MIKKNILLFIDGITRSGKSCLCQTIVSLKNVEHVDLNFNFEYLFAGVVKKKINLPFAKSYFDSLFSRYTYDRILGRNLNLIKNDFTSIYNYYNPKIYLERIKKNTLYKNYHYKKTTQKKKLYQDHVFNYLKSNIIYFPIQSHYFLENFKVLKKLELNFKMIRINRHPVDNIYSYFKRGYGKIKKFNYDYNYKIASFSEKKQNILIPWWLDISLTNYLNLNEIERCIYAIISNLKKINQNQKIKNVHMVNFDNLCTKPKTEFKLICKFLKVKKQNNFNQFLKKANLPRKINKFTREKKLKFLLKNCNNLNLIEELNKQIKIFENK